MVKEKRGINPKAFKEVSEIIKYFPRNEYTKIPKSFISFIEENMDSDYNYEVNHVDDFHNQEMLEETKIILSIIYRDFIATEEEQKQIIDKESKKLLEEEQKNREKYNPDMLFINKKSKEEKTIKIIKKKESVFDKILKWFKKFFKK